MGRMDLSAIGTGRRRDPLKILVYGPPGVGKTTFSASAPGAVIIPAEDGAGRIDCAKFPRPKTWEEVREAIRLLKSPGHPYKTLVIDTLDAAEPMWQKKVCDESGKPSIEAFGFGKGFVAACDEVRATLADLEALQEARGTNIVLVCHAVTRGFSNPTGDDYDRWTLRLQDSKTASAASLFRDWVDIILFATHDDIAVKSENGKKVGVSTGARLLRTRHSAAYEAKSRLDLPDPIPLSWAAFQAEVEIALADSAALKSMAEAQIKNHPKAAEWVVVLAKASESELRAAVRHLRAEKK